MNPMYSNSSETLAEGQQIITVCAFIHHNFAGIEKVLLPKRAATRKFLPNVFELPGGHVEYGEDLLEALKREAKEELGVEIKIGDPFDVFTYINQTKKSHSVEIDYFATLIGDISQIKLNPEEHSDYRWVAEDEIAEISALNRLPNDREIVVIQKGFLLLSGQKINFGN